MTGLLHVFGSIVVQGIPVKLELQISVVDQAQALNVKGVLVNAFAAFQPAITYEFTGVTIL